MPIRIETKAHTLIAALSGEIDHHAATPMRLEIDEKIDTYEPKTLILDFGAVTFMDSAGIGLILGRYRQMEARGGSLVIQNPPPHIRRVLRISGMERIAEIQNRKPEQEDLL